MRDPGEIARFYDRCSDFMRALLEALATTPDRPRPFPEIEDAIGWPRRRIASVLGGVSRLRHTEFGGRRPYRFLDTRQSASGAGRCGWTPRRRERSRKSSPRRTRRVIPPDDDTAARMGQHRRRTWSTEQRTGS